MPRRVSNGSTGRRSRGAGRGRRGGVERRRGGAGWPAGGQGQKIKLKPPAAAQARGPRTPGLTRQTTSISFPLPSTLQQKRGVSAATPRPVQTGCPDRADRADQPPPLGRALVPASGQAVDRPLLTLKADLSCLDQRDELLAAAAQTRGVRIVNRAGSGRSLDGLWELARLPSGVSAVAGGVSLLRLAPTAGCYAPSPFAARLPAPGGRWRSVRFPSGAEREQACERVVRDVLHPL